MPKPIVAQGKELFKVRPLIWTAERWRSRLDSVRAFRFTGGAFLPRRPWGTMWVSLNNVSDRLRHVVAARNADGRLEVFGTAADDSIWHNWQTAPNNGWSGWALFHSGVDRLRRLVVGQNKDGRLEVFGVDGGDGIWHTWQTAPHAFPSDSSLRREGVLGEYSVG